MNERLRRRRKDRSGQSAIEAALVMVVFLVTVIGILDIGQVLFIHQGLVERARNGARYGIVNSYDETQIRNVVLYNQPTAPDNGSSGFLGLTASMVSVQRGGTPGASDDRVTVTISNYPYQFFTPLLAGSFTARPIIASLPMEAL
jgi:Flp pilus assembly protein TadG